MGCPHGRIAMGIIIAGQDIDVGFVPPVSRGFLFREPPGMFGGHHPRVHSREELGPLPNLSPGRFDGDPVALPDAFFFRGLRMNFHHRVSVKFPEPGELTILGMEKTRLPPAGNQDVGIFPVKLRRAVGALRRFLESDQGIVSPLLKQRGIEFEFSRGGGKTLLPVIRREETWRSLFIPI